MWYYIFVVIIFEAFAPVFSFTDIIISVDNEKKVIINAWATAKDDSTDHIVDTRLTGDQLAYVKQQAKSENITVSAMIRKIINERKDLSVEE